MRQLKRICCMVLMILAVSLGGCQREKVEKNQLRIGALKGPTGMGLAELMANKGNEYDIAIYDNPDELVGKIINNETDIAFVPSHLGAVLYQKTGKKVKLLGISTLGTLYIVENGEKIDSLEDLKDKKLLTSGKGSTPQYVLQQLLKDAGIQETKEVPFQFMGSHLDVVTALVAQEGSVALLPQPYVAMAKAKNDRLHIALDLNEIWEQEEEKSLPMGIIIINKNYLEKEPERAEEFFKDYQASVKFVNTHIDEGAQLIVQQGILTDEAVTRKAIPYCHIVAIQSKEAKQDLEKFYTILERMDAKGVGGTLPDEAFYEN